LPFFGVAQRKAERPESQLVQTTWSWPAWRRLALCLFILYAGLVNDNFARRGSAQAVAHGRIQPDEWLGCSET